MTIYDYLGFTSRSLSDLEGYLSILGIGEKRELDESELTFDVYEARMCTRQDYDENIIKHQ